MTKAVYGVSGRRVFFEHQPLILVMDDNELVLDLAKDILGRAGVRVVAVNSLSRARQLLREEGQNIRLAILDWRMGRRMAWIWPSKCTSTASGGDCLF